MTIGSGTAAARSALDCFFPLLKRERTKDEILPWDMLNCGVSKEFLWREWQTSKEAKVSPNCRQSCMGCGGAGYGVGICFQPKTGV